MGEKPGQHRTMEEKPGKTMRAPQVEEELGLMSEAVDHLELSFGNLLCLLEKSIMRDPDPRPEETNAEERKLVPLAASIRSYRRLVEVVTSQINGARERIEI